MTELARLAGEQEVALRSFVQSSPGSPAPGDLTASSDLAELLGRLASASVTVSLPGGPVPSPAASEVLAAVSQALSNVRHHVGRDAPAWVLLEDLGDRWAVSVRDEGPGIPDGRLSEAASEGRLGVAQSIIGRMRDLGGTATVHSAPGQGTEWELVWPKESS
jgi:signal transduction histidine kinase